MASLRRPTNAAVGVGDSVRAKVASPVSQVSKVRLVKVAAQGSRAAAHGYGGVLIGWVGGQGDFNQINVQQLTH